MEMRSSTHAMMDMFQSAAVRELADPTRNGRVQHRTAKVNETTEQVRIYFICSSTVVAE